MFWVSEKTIKSDWSEVGNLTMRKVVNSGACTKLIDQQTVYQYVTNSAVPNQMAD